MKPTEIFPNIEAARARWPGAPCEECPLSIDEFMALLRCEVLQFDIAGGECLCAVWVPDDVAREVGVAIGKQLLRKLHPEVRDET